MFLHKKGKTPVFDMANAAKWKKSGVFYIFGGAEGERGEFPVFFKN